MRFYKSYFDLHVNARYIAYTYSLFFYFHLSLWLFGIFRDSYDFEKLNIIDQSLNKLEIISSFIIIQRQFILMLLHFFCIVFFQFRIYPYTFLWLSYEMNCQILQRTSTFSMIIIYVQFLSILKENHNLCYLYGVVYVKI